MVAGSGRALATAVLLADRVRPRPCSEVPRPGSAARIALVRGAAGDACASPEYRAYVRLRARQPRATPIRHRGRWVMPRHGSGLRIFVADGLENPVGGQLVEIGERVDVLASTEALGQHRRRD